ncbi:MAG: 4Fe-4S dicluster domain-containing protein [Scytolyngbya sp. HA4215-MV1]|nr:4Fe-4S dicluster domain-containing protein [Scytolyngbya sp. HA4215-MV1]
MTDLYDPLNSLREGHWFKLICGASFQHLPAVRNLALAYALAGADCIDVAADPAVIASAREALQSLPVLAEAAQARGFAEPRVPWLMVSLNDGEDPHFRKAAFRASDCPIECHRPCEQICPTQAITFQASAQAMFDQTAAEGFSGVLSDRCYGCGRCLPVCPVQHIHARSYVSMPATVAPLVLQQGIDALEIHTQVGRLTDFARLWSAILPWLNRLKLIAISCPDGEGLIDYLWALYNIMTPLPCALVWQTDGRPMSGDIGVGTTRAAVKLGQKVLAAGLPGFVQLAGGTNQHTVAKLREIGLLKTVASSPNHPVIAGIAYGSYARVLLAPLLEQLEKGVTHETLFCSQNELQLQTSDGTGTSTVVAPRSRPGLESSRLESVPDLLWHAVSLALSLTSQLKSSCY